MAKSRAEANRVAESYGLRKDTFRLKYTSETRNETEVGLANKFGFIVCLSGTRGGEFIDIESVYNSGSNKDELIL